MPTPTRRSERAADGAEHAALDQRTQGEEVVAERRKAVADAALGLAVHELMRVRLLERLGRAAVLQAGDGDDERDGDEVRSWLRMPISTAVSVRKSASFR